MARNGSTTHIVYYNINGDDIARFLGSKHYLCGVTRIRIIIIIIIISEKRTSSRLEISNTASSTPRPSVCNNSIVRNRYTIVYFADVSHKVREKYCKLTAATVAGNALLIINVPWLMSGKNALAGNTCFCRRTRPNVYTNTFHELFNRIKSKLGEYFRGVFRYRKTS